MISITQIYKMQRNILHLLPIKTTQILYWYVQVLPLLPAKCTKYSLTTNPLYIINWFVKLNLKLHTSLSKNWNVFTREATIAAGPFIDVECCQTNLVELLHWEMTVLHWITLSMQPYVLLLTGQSNVSEMGCNWVWTLNCWNEINMEKKLLVHLEQENFYFTLIWLNNSSLQTPEPEQKQQHKANDKSFTNFTI